jgi:NitT/TauT family transport system substrate-binding protein
MADVVPGQPGSLRVFSQQFIEKRPDVARKFMVGLLRGNRDYENAMTRNENRQQVIDVMVKYTTVKDRSFYDKVSPQKLTLDGSVAVQGVQQMVDFFRAKGAMDQPMDVRTAIDTSFAEYAVKRLGAYS